MIIVLSSLLFVQCFAEQINYNKMLYYNSLIPIGCAWRSRIITTLCCDDCSLLPRVEHAGQIIYENDGSCYQLMHNGLKVARDCYYGSWMTTLIELSKGFHEPQEEKAFHEVLKYMPQNAVMVEMGSYWSYYSMWFQKNVSGARNFLIEPDPKNLIIGQENFALNGMSGHFTQAMVGAVSKDNQSLTAWDRLPYVTYTVKQVCLDDFAIKNNIDFFHMVHSDIQGAEADMLQGCQRLIAEKRIGFFFISTHGVNCHNNCLKILENANYSILLSVTDEESFSADGVIVAKLSEIDGPGCIEVSRRTAQFSSLAEQIAK